VVQENPEYNEKRCKAFVCDPTCEPLPEEIPDNSVDAVLLIFVLSAISPEKMGTVLKKAFDVRALRCLSPARSFLCLERGCFVM